MTGGTKLLCISIEDYMDANYVKIAMEKLNEPISSIDIKTTIKDDRYAEIRYYTTDALRRAEHNLRGCVLPYSCPVMKFQIAASVNSATKLPKYKIYVQGLEGNLNNYEVYERFNQHYDSLFAVVQERDDNNDINGKAILSFTKENEANRAVVEMNGNKALGLGKLETSKEPFKVESDDSDEEILVDPEHFTHTDINEEYMKTSEELYGELECSRWNPLNLYLSQITITPRI